MTTLRYARAVVHNSTVSHQKLVLVSSGKGIIKVLVQDATYQDDPSATGSLAPELTIFTGDLAAAVSLMVEASS